MTTPKVQTFGDAFIDRKVIAQAIEYDDGGHEIAHAHLRVQLIYATRGIVRVVTPLGLWMLTPGHALLIGSNIMHELQMVGPVSMRTLYIQPEVLRRHANDCRAIAVNPLLRESILGMFDPTFDEGDTRQALLAPLILRLIDSSFLSDANESLRNARLPLPAHARLRRICESLIAQPASIDTLERWAEPIGASARTVARLFKQETGMSFGQWREQLRLTEAMSRLAIGRPVAQIAQDLGYADTRTFAVMFRRAVGTTPHQFAVSDR